MSRPSRRGPLVAAVVVLVALVPAVWLGLRAGGGASDRAAEAPAPDAPSGPFEVPVGEPATLSVDGLDVTMAITAEHDVDEALLAVPAGRTTVLTVTVADGDGDAVELDPLPAIGQEGEGDRVERVAVDLDAGAVAATGPDGEVAWEVGIAPGGDEVVVSDDGRWVAVVHGEGGAVEVVDVLERRSAGRFVLGSTADDTIFSPAGTTLWVLDTAGGRLVAVDVAVGRPTRVVAAPDIRAVAVLDDGELVALAADGSVLVLDAETGDELATAELEGEVVAAAAVADGVLVATADGMLQRLDVGDDGTLLPAWSTATGAEVATVAAEGDGRAVALDPTGDRALVVEPATGEVVAEVATADEPVAVSFLDGLAVVRNAGSPALTWIDLAEPASVGEVVLGGEAPAAMGATGDGGGLLVTSPSEGAAYVLQARLGRPVVVDQDPIAEEAERLVEVAVAAGRTAPGTYRLRTTFDDPGTTTVVVDLGGDRVVEFDVQVAAPAEPAADGAGGGVGDEEASAPPATVVPAAVEAGRFERFDGAEEATLTPVVPGTWRIHLVDGPPTTVPRNPFEAQ